MLILLDTRTRSNITHSHMAQTFLLWDIITNGEIITTRHNFQHLHPASWTCKFQKFWPVYSVTSYTSSKVNLSNAHHKSFRKFEVSLKLLTKKITECIIENCYWAFTAVLHDRRRNNEISRLQAATVIRHCNIRT